MIRDENLAVFLKCILEVLNGSVRDELQTAHTKSLVDALVSVLGRMVAEVGDARDIAAEQLDDWHLIVEKFTALGFTNNIAISADTNPLIAVEHTTQKIQTALKDEKSYNQFVASLKQGDPATKQWLSNIADTLNKLLQGVEDSYYRPQGLKGTTSVADNLGLLEKKLNTYLCQHYPTLPETPIKKFTLIPGGQIKRTVIMRLKDNKLLPTRLVLRQDMDMEYTGTTVVDEFKIIKRVFDLGLPVPEPILIEPNAETLGDGGCFMIMTEVEDAQPAGTYFGEDRAHIGHNMGPEIGQDLAKVLAKLHGQTIDTTLGAGDRVTQKQQEKFEQVKAAWRKQGKPSFSLSIDLGMAWMEANPLTSQRPYCLLHGDLGSHNLMTRDGKLAALIDWELAVMGDPAADLAQLKMMLLDFVIPWDEFKSIYIAEGGPSGAVDDHAVAFYGIWAYIFHLSMATNLWENFNNGVRDDAAAAGVASSSIDRMTLYESRALAYAITLM